MSTWPLDDLVGRLRDLHSIVANEAADQLERMQVALSEALHVAAHALEVQERLVAEVEALRARLGNGHAS